jgi:hypothetical protein
MSKSMSEWHVTRMEQTLKKIFWLHAKKSIERGVFGQQKIFLGLSLKYWAVANGIFSMEFAMSREIRRALNLETSDLIEILFKPSGDPGWKIIIWFEGFLRELKRKEERKGGTAYAYSRLRAQFPNNVRKRLLFETDANHRTMLKRLDEVNVAICFESQRP